MIHKGYKELPDGTILRIARKPKKSSKIRFIIWKAWNIKWDSFALKFRI